MVDVVITLNEQIDEIKRELKQRERVYPRMIAQGKLRQAIAEYQMARMQAALATVEQIHAVAMLDRTVAEMLKR